MENQSLLKQLAEQYKFGEQEEGDLAITKLITTNNYSYYLSYAHKFVHDDHQARSAVNEALIALLLKNLVDRKKIDSPHALILRIIRNKAIDFFNSTIRERERQKKFLEKNTTAFIHPFAYLLESIPSEAEYHLKRCSETALSPDLKQVYHLMMEDLEHQEIVARLGLSSKETTRKKEKMQRQLKRCILKNLKIS